MSRAVLNCPWNKGLRLHTTARRNTPGLNGLGRAQEIVAFPPAGAPWSAPDLPSASPQNRVMSTASSSPTPTADAARFSLAGTACQSTTWRERSSLPRCGTPTRSVSLASTPSGQRTRQRPPPTPSAAVLPSWRGSSRTLAITLDLWSGPHLFTTAKQHGLPPATEPLPRTFLGGFLP